MHSLFATRAHLLSPRPRPLSPRLPVSPRSAASQHASGRLPALVPPLPLPPAPLVLASRRDVVHCARDRRRGRCHRLDGAPSSPYVLCAPYSARPCIPLAALLSRDHQTRDLIQPLVITPGKELNLKYGFYRHADLVGVPYGSKVRSRNGKGFIHLLRPTPELWTLALPHRTQILYLADIAFVVSWLDIKPGSRVIEAGTYAPLGPPSFPRTFLYPSVERALGAGCQRDASEDDLCVPCVALDVCARVPCVAAAARSSAGRALPCVFVRCPRIRRGRRMLVPRQIATSLSTLVRC